MCKKLSRRFILKLMVVSAVALTLASCGRPVEEAFATNTNPALTETLPPTAIHTKTPTATVQAPENETIVTIPIETAPAESIIWAPPTGYEPAVPGGEPAPGFFKDYNLSGLGIIASSVEYHTNNLSGVDSRWTLTARDILGNVIWALDESGKPFDYPIFFTPKTDEGGNTVGFEVSNTTPWGEHIKYSAIGDSRGADVVFAGGNLPVLVKDRVVAPDGRDVFLEYFDKATGDWVVNNTIVDASGQPVTWNDKEWVVKPPSSWQEVAPTADLSPGSERYNLLESMGISTGMGINSSGGHEEEFGSDFANYHNYSFNGVLEQVATIKVDEPFFSGDAVVLFVNLKVGDGSIVRIPVLGAIYDNRTRKLGHPGFLRSNDDTSDISYKSSIESITDHYKKLLDSKFSISGAAFVYNDQNTNGFDPKILGSQLFNESGVPLGQSKYEPSNNYYNFVVNTCTSQNECYAAIMQSPSGGQDMASYLALAAGNGNDWPFGVLVQAYGLTK